MSISRRTLVLAGTGAALGAAALLRPSETGAPHDAYFAGLSQALRQSGAFNQVADASTPRMVLDRDRLQANIAAVMAKKDPQLPLRVVAKSLASLPLIDFIAKQTSQGHAGMRLMVFNLPYLLLQASTGAKADLLVGKPLPVGAAQAFYRELQPNGFEPKRQLQWLIDTPERLAEYAQLARGLGQPLRVNLEIDVGLHRGGFANAESMAKALALLKAEPLLQFAGLMGYDPHITEIPDLPGARSKAERHAKQVYADFKAQALSALPSIQAAALTWNAAGSPTYQLHKASGAANEVSVGSAFVKPTHFDFAHLSAVQPAFFIASPVLKSGPFQLPAGVEWIGSAAQMWDRNQRHGVFLYGGEWRADPVSPTGLATSGLYGQSPNQQVMVGSGRQQLKVGDTVFWRPHKSEAILQQFGDLIVVAGGQVVDRWAVMPPAP